MPRWDVNCSILLTELPLLQRPRAAREAGFGAVELWWPFERAVPADREVAALVAAVRDAGVQLVSLNAYGGDLAAGERGLAAVPGRAAEFRDNLDVALGLVAELACPTLHVLHGRGDPDLAVEHLALAATRAASVGATVVVEALSGIDGYPLRTAADVLRVLDRVAEAGATARMLCDVHHLTVNGDDPVAVVRQHADRIGHVQVADPPGRHQPGTGTLDLPAVLRALTDVGYAGWVGLEYVPLGPSAASFGWLAALEDASGPAPARGSAPPT